MSESVMRPLPSINHLYAPYYKGLRERKILVQKCDRCGHVQWPPRDFCYKCHSAQLSWTEMPQEGKVYTYSIYYRSFHPAFNDRLPMGVAVVDLGKGVKVLGNFIGNDVENIECGLKVKAVFEDINEEITLIHWERT